MGSRRESLSRPAMTDLLRTTREDILKAAHTSEAWKLWGATQTAVVPNGHFLLCGTTSRRVREVVCGWYCGSGAGAGGGAGVDGKDWFERELP